METNDGKKRRDSEFQHARAAVQACATGLVGSASLTAPV